MVISPFGGEITIPEKMLKVSWRGFGGTFFTKKVPPILPL
jgi:hypothetical protein